MERQPNSFRERSVGSTDDRDERARSVPGSREASAPRDMANGLSRYCNDHVDKSRTDRMIYL